ncbi:MAG: glycine cleavage T C-terminal barrel domain-containing protein, partial [Pseudomonadota bacterium]
LMKGEVVGSTGSSAYGFTIGKFLAFAYVKPEVAKPDQDLEVVIMNKARKARILDAPAYDPDSLLPRTDAAVGMAAE